MAENNERKDGEPDVVIDEDGGVHVSGNDGIHINIPFGKGKRRGRKSVLRVVPVSLLAIAAYLLMGFLIPCGRGWDPGWLVFFVVPLWHVLIGLIERRRLCYGGIETIALAAYLFMGLVEPGLWHPTWVVFFIVPAYYSVRGTIRDIKKK